jgi:hypothetical protein
MLVDSHPEESHAADNHDRLQGLVRGR